MALRPRVMFAAAAAVLSTIVALAALAMLDLYLHQRYLDESGYNVWGYRGPVVERKQPGELRVAMVGGSTVFGYGVRWRESIPAHLERQLTAAAGRVVSVINLGWMGEGAYAFAPVLRDYAGLDYDVVVLYEGYNDLPEAPNHKLFRQSSPIFRATGYMPILPLIVEERLTMLQRREADDEQVVFDGAPADPGAATAVHGTLAGRVEELAAAPQQDAADAPPCGRWAEYCAAVLRAVEYARSAGKGVLIVGQPILSPAHADQQAALSARVAALYADDPMVRYVSVEGAVDLTDTQVAYDGMHLVSAGNARIAGALVPEVLDLAGREAR